MIELGRIYSAKGPTFEADNAIFWYYKAAATEDAEGLAALAKVYLAGELMVQNYKEAVRLLEESARVG